ncbi:Putrescine transport system permease protein PotH [Pseudomonas sp. XWY-1]|nr:Putrescine transport system permease protein PotH [Pseudomonas sp. XWY-1]
MCCGGECPATGRNVRSSSELSLPRIACLGIVLSARRLLRPAPPAFAGTLSGFFDYSTWPEASALAVVMLAILIVPILLFNRSQAKEMEGRA